MPLGLYLVDVLHKGFTNFNSLYYIFHVLYCFMVQLGNLSKQLLALCLTYLFKEACGEGYISRCTHYAEYWKIYKFVKKNMLSISYKQNIFLKIFFFYDNRLSLWGMIQIIVCTIYSLLLILCAFDGNISYKMEKIVWNSSWKREITFTLELCETPLDQFYFLSL